MAEILYGVFLISVSVVHAIAIERIDRRSNEKLKQINEEHTRAILEISRARNAELIQILQDRGIEVKVEQAQVH